MRGEKTESSNRKDSGAGETGGRPRLCKDVGDWNSPSRREEGLLHYLRLFPRCSRPTRSVPEVVLSWIRGPELKLGAPGSGPEAAAARRVPAVLAPAGALRLRRGPGVAMTSELDIFVGNTTLIDEDVYRLWLDGYSGLWGAVWGCPSGRTVVLDGRGGGSWT